MEIELELNPACFLLCTKCESDFPLEDLTPLPCSFVSRLLNPFRETSSQLLSYKQPAKRAILVQLFN